MLLGLESRIEGELKGTVVWEKRRRRTDKASVMIIAVASKKEKKTRMRLLETEKRGNTKAELLLGGDI